MILCEREDGLPAHLQVARAQVLICLQATNHLHEFDRVDDLEADLDQLLDQIEAAGYPRGLTRIVLFTRRAGAVEAVKRRLVPFGAQLEVFGTPDCWGQLARKLPDLKAWADRIEPGWLAQHGVRR